MSRLHFRPRHRARTSSSPQLEAMEGRLLLATIVVTGTGDNIADDGIVTLREAITAANTNAASGDAAAGDIGLDTIDFDIPGTGVQTIASATDLPAITEPIAIDGYSQPGTHANTSGPGLGDDAVLRIQIVPTQLRAGSRGLLVSGGRSSVRGLVINEFTYGIDLRSSGGNTIAGDYIGTTPDGLSRVANGMEDGILLQSSNNTIGGTAPADRGVLNAPGSAIHVPNNPVAEASNNVIKGNFIGTDAPGTNGVGAYEGIEIESGSGDQIGGGEPGAGNLISSVSKAIFVDLGGPDPGYARNGNGGHVIQGNLIGTDVTGTFLLPSNAFSSGPSVGNEQQGIFISGVVGPQPVDPQPIVIGGNSPGEGNVIAGSQSTPGILFHYPDGFGAPSSIEGNFIGTDRTGVKNLGNWAGGIVLGTTNVTVTHNTIAYNGTAAVNVPAGETAILVVDNSIYDNAGGAPGIVRQIGASPPIPILASITVAGPTATVPGTAQGAAGSTVRVDLYANAPPPQGIFVQGQTLVQTIQVPIGPDGNGSFTATFPTVASQPLITATATSPSNTTSPFSEPATLPDGASADLSFTVADSPDPVAPDGTITYDLSVTNEGPDAASGVSLVDDVPAGTTFVSFAAPTGWTASTPAVGGTGSVSATADALSNGAGAAFTLVVRVGPEAADGSTIVDSASVSASQSTDNAPNNNTGGATTTVAATTPPPVTADLEVTQSASPGTATVGLDAVTFTITVTNRGPGSASNAVLTETLPAGANFVSATGGVAQSDGKLTFPLGDMATGASLTFTVVVQPRSAGALTASATASATTADPSTVNNTATASSSAVDPTIVHTPTPTPTATPAAGMDGPHIVRVQRFGIHTMPTTVVLTFDMPLGGAAARNAKNYRVTDTRGARIAVRSAVYDAAAHTVTLRTAQRISIHRPYKLVVRGTGPDGLSDVANHLIDGQGTGQPGTDYATRLTWRNLVLPAWYRSARTSSKRDH
jgi:uncharacterized repeat protein (TIGR01451 family)